MEAILDSSTLISLAWAGRLDVLAIAPLRFVVPDVVRSETITAGLAAGYPDATAIEAAASHMAEAATRPTARADDAVLEAARGVGVLIANDLTLGRRAQNVGVRWLRTPDVVVLCVRTERLDHARGRAALRALHGAGRITDELFDPYLEELS